ncbi:MAG: proline--tRNA ligase, partial [Thermoleophilia bacterium]|nr:proline--tRNA ligase [Thermoleophilia bacterium]
QVQAAIEVGHIFKLGTFHSRALGAMYLDDDGTQRAIVMGSYGIGPGRVIAAVVEQHHDERGIVWPREVAPYTAHVVALPGAEELAERVAAQLDEEGEDVLLDERDLRAGEKFADADLIGCPTRVTVGKRAVADGVADIRDRATGEERELEIGKVTA